MLSKPPLGPETYTPLRVRSSPRAESRVQPGVLPFSGTGIDLIHSEIIMGCEGDSKTSCPEMAFWGSINPLSTLRIAATPF